MHLASYETAHGLLEDLIWDLFTVASKKVIVIVLKNTFIM